MDKQSNRYKNAGVDVTAGYKSVELIKPLIEKTKTKGVIGNIGSFAGFFNPDFNKYKNPILVASTDGVGTKIKLAINLDLHDKIGIDCVAMCANDIICTGASPLFFLDYIACGKNIPEKIALIVSGIAEGCKEAKMALIGGETAEHPKIMKENEYDIAGFAVGIVEKENILPKENLEPNDVLIGLASSGIHSNGFSLIREIFNIDDIENLKTIDRNILDKLLKPTKIYVCGIENLLENIKVKALCHITGGGFYENIPRMLPKNITATIYEKNLKIPDIFKIIRKKGNITKKDMFNVFNMGIGMVAVVSKKDEENAIKILNSNNILAYTIGKLSAEDRKINIV